MDKIKTTDEALQSVYATLKLLNGTVETLTQTAIGEISSELGGIETNTRSVMQDYLKKITEFQKSLDHCIDEHTAAIGERMSKLATYTTAVYKKRKINGISV